jgi:hypothetical protein
VVRFRQIGVNVDPYAAHLHATVYSRRVGAVSSLAAVARATRTLRAARTRRRAPARPTSPPN